MSIDNPFILAKAIVRSVERPSPSFARVTFGGSDLDEFGTPGRTFDQRIKIIFPPQSGALPNLRTEGADWYAAWLEVPEDERGVMRTYSVRDVRAEARGTTVVVDMVLHLDPGSSGPGASWAGAARPGDQVLIVGPRRGIDGGGIEFAPGHARWVLLAGDETAAPAIARIIEDGGPELQGVAFIEVPQPDDVLSIAAPSGFDVRWLPRGSGAGHGSVLLPAVLEHLGAAPNGSLGDARTDDEGLLWETPTYSGLGEDVSDGPRPSDRYFWIAGESGVVTALRRHLVNDLAIGRSQVAFMGYWRLGTSMRG